MSEIDFLANKKNDSDQEAKPREEKNQETVWSEPKADRPSAGKIFSGLPFLKKKEAPAAPVLAEEKIKESRRKILELIKNHDAARPEVKKKNNVLAAWGEKLKKPKSHHEILIDYQRLFNDEKDKRRQPPRNFQSIGATEPIKKVPALSAAAKPKNDFFNNLFKLLKGKIAAFNLPKTAPKKIISRPVVEKAKPIIKTPAEPAPKTVSKKETEKKVMPEVEELNQNQQAVPPVLETNLIKGEIVTFFDWHKQMVVLAMAILLPSFFIAAAYFGINAYEKQMLNKSEDRVANLNELNQKIKTEEAGLEEATDFQNRLSLAAKVFSRHIYWTNFFKFLEDNTVKKVYYSGFDGDTGGNYAFDALTKDYQSIVDELKLLKGNDKIVSAEAQGGETSEGSGLDESGVKFTLKFSVKKSLFIE